MTRLPRFAEFLLFGVVAIGAVCSSAAAQSADANVLTAPPPAAPTVAAIPNQVCLACHSVPGFGIPGPNGKMRSLFVDTQKFTHSVHGNRMCVECHTNITAVPHQPVEIKVDCISCHERSWEKAAQKPNTQQAATLNLVVSQIHKFLSSIHAQPSRVDQSRTNATCYNCHQPHYVYPPGTPVWSQWRMNLPNICGTCHTKELAAYKTSVHGREVLQKHNPKAAICADCHTSHDIANPVLTSTKLVITKNCGSCHKEQLQTYMATYHGQVSTLGYGYTAKCFDCHGYHTIQRVSDPRSTVYPANRLTTCRKCHANASAGFLTFEPHGNAHDFKRYPLLWLAAKFMSWLLIGVFAFFWTHSALWFYRSYKERVARGEPVEFYLYRSPDKNEPYFRRFAAVWRIAHLLVLLATMTLVLTGMTVLYSDSPWAPVVVRLFGGPNVMAIVHRVCASIFISVFFGHVIYMFFKLRREGRRFRWFGPDSLVVRWQDFRDIIAMFRWFFGLGPRPEFDRWTYWEKFDYWAVFWGIFIIGGSGVILWFKAFALQFLPGWVLNVALIVHGDEALLAAVFLFTVHFFNNHFRPDKFPLDTAMFTGAITLEEFKREHRAEYDRLVKTGKLESRRVPAPSPFMALGSRILGFALLTIGLVLLLLVAIGFFGHGA
ncbi:MAG: cytochrome c3 family protein [Alphaproteobacteria bacterium]|nr:cytochrome c3 family protein [Alphaproteobacteria bacterium]MDE2492452.1 cytochrome c3 family protein [Alphaproteobacteria bacterium]